MARYVEPASYAAARIFGNMAPNVLENSGTVRSGVKYFKEQRKGPQMVGYYQGEVGQFRPVGYNSRFHGWTWSETWQTRKERIEEKKAKGIFPTKKGQGKASSKKKR